MSLQELSLRDGAVVCPQCLTSYQAVAAGELPAQDDLRPTTKTAPDIHYCPHCGEGIGHGINYCPYCGGNLHQASEIAAPTADSGPSAPAPAAAAPSRGKKSSRRGHHHQDGSHGEDNEKQSFDWKPIIPSYRLAQIRRHEPASLRFQAFAIATILVLLALLAYIIYQAYLINV